MKRFYDGLKMRKRYKGEKKGYSSVRVVIQFFAIPFLIIAGPLKEAKNWLLDLIGVMFAMLLALVLCLVILFLMTIGVIPWREEVNRIP